MISAEGFTFCTYFFENRWRFSLYFQGKRQNKKEGKENVPMVEKSNYPKIDLGEELASYDVDKKWNDYIGLQKSIIDTLRSEGFFENNVVENMESGMLVRITTKGIKETLGAGKRFQSLPKVLKELKIATLRYLPEIIKQGSILEDNVENKHKTEEYMFAYIMSNVVIDNEEYKVRISIKKKVASNLFWIHHIDYMKKDFVLLDPSRGKELKERQNP